MEPIAVSAFAGKDVQLRADDKGVGKRMTLAKARHLAPACEVQDIEVHAPFVFVGLVLGVVPVIEHQQRAGVEDHWRVLHGLRAERHGNLDQLRLGGGGRCTGR